MAFTVHFLQTHWGLVQPQQPMLWLAYMKSIHANKSNCLRELKYNYFPAGNIRSCCLSQSQRGLLWILKIKGTEGGGIPMQGFYFNCQDSPPNDPIILSTLAFNLLKYTIKYDQFSHFFCPTSPIPPNTDLSELNFLTFFHFTYCLFVNHLLTQISAAQQCRCKLPVAMLLKRNDFPSTSSYQLPVIPQVLTSRLVVGSALKFGTLSTSKLQTFLLYSCSFPLLV